MGIIESTDVAGKEGSLIAYSTQKSEQITGMKGRCDSISLLLLYSFCMSSICD